MGVGRCQAGFLRTGAGIRGLFWVGFPQRNGHSDVSQGDGSSPKGVLAARRGVNGLNSPYMRPDNLLSFLTPSVVATGVYRGCLFYADIRLGSKALFGEGYR